jgi:hypothetical protein
MDLGTKPLSRWVLKLIRFPRLADTPLIKLPCTHIFPKTPLAPPAPQIWGEIATFLSSKSPRIGGFRGLDKINNKTKDLCVHSSLIKEGRGDRVCQLNFN